VLFRREIYRLLTPDGVAIDLTVISEETCQNLLCSERSPPRTASFRSPPLLGKAALDTAIQMIRL